MKGVFLVFLVFISVGCSVKESASMTKELKAKTSTFCENEILLLSDSLRNWRIPADSIKSMDEYFEKCSRQILLSDSQSNLNETLDLINQETDFFSEDTSSGTSPHPNVFPYITIDSIDISFMQLLRPTGGGYTAHAEDVLWLTCESEAFRAGDGFSESISRFIYEFKPRKKPANNECFRIQGPVINLTFNNGSFPNLETVTRGIVKGYLNAQTLNAQKIYRKNLCELEDEEILELKNLYPLKIRLIKHG